MSFITYEVKYDLLYTSILYITFDRVKIAKEQ